MPKRDTRASAPALPGAPKWVADAVARDWGALVALAGAERVPTGGPASPARPSDASKEAATLATGDPTVCLRVTASAHEAGFAAAMLHERRAPDGFARPLGVARLTTKLRGHNTFAVWREALSPDAALPTWEKVGPFRRHLELFGLASAAALKALRWPKGPEALEREAWAMARTAKGHVAPGQMATPAALAATLGALSGARRAAVALSAARLSARLLEGTPGGELVGAGLGHWLDRGMLLDGIDGACLGTAKRDGKPRAVIVEPGRPCLFDPTYGNLRIDPVLEAAPLPPASRRSNPASKRGAFRVTPSGELIGWKVMQWDPTTGDLVSGANSAIRLRPEAPSHAMPGRGIYVGASERYVRDHYAQHDYNAVIEYAFAADDVVHGSIYDREPEVAVRRAKVVKVEVYDEDGNRVR